MYRLPMFFSKLFILTLEMFVFSAKEAMLSPDRTLANLILVARMFL